ncbi:class I SAM-dependent methyltransferase [Sphingomonas sp. BT-65]|uniref:class I SAM-dependent methyltransferase n=1 Tax=Sphingomonas sp. BT-65 TaxID=2989821 RepID=UPI0022366BB7|nr:class I SAM-dependent methyltransferase [Sphingomonas sp. BT-65]MCW4461675.1 class I SAM-dependent methyltransferase [Sphingomonas sp. BT-65]
MDDAITDYAANATPELIAGYDALPPEQIYAAVLDLFPDAPARIADIGAGTGRDAAWFGRQGHRVLAVEPVRAFREAGAALHGDAIEWLDDQLPELGETARRGPFDLVLLCAVWHHLDTQHRARAMPALARMTAPGGMLILSLRHEPGTLGRHSYPAPPKEAIDLASAAGFDLIRRAEAPAVHPLSRASGVHWTWLAFARAAG